jgi:hypothetical protein
MADIRFIQQDGQSVDMATIRHRFFESASAAKVNPQRATHIWNAAMLGDSYARNMIEDLCKIQFVRSDAGFGFLE